MRDPSSSSAEEDKWMFVENDRVHRVVGKMRGLGRDGVSRFEQSLDIRDLLSRLEYCVGSDRFQTRIFNRIQTVSEEDKWAEDEFPNNELDEFVMLDHMDVVDALAEYLVLTYIDKYHADEIEQLRNNKTSKFKTLIAGIGKTLGDLAKSKALESAWKMGVSVATSSLGMAVLAYANPQFAIASISILWQILKFTFKVLL
jgi:hypothetical protein